MDDISNCWKMLIVWLTMRLIVRCILASQSIEDRPSKRHKASCETCVVVVRVTFLKCFLMVAPILSVVAKLSSGIYTSHNMNNSVLVRFRVNCEALKRGDCRCSRAKIWHLVIILYLCISCEYLVPLKEKKEEVSRPIIPDISSKMNLLYWAQASIERSSYVN